METAMLILGKAMFAHQKAVVQLGTFLYGGDQCVDFVGKSVLVVIAHGTADVGNLTRIFTGRSDAAFGDATRSAVLARASHAAVRFDPGRIDVLNVKAIVEAT